MRARNIKPAFFLSEQLAACSPHARLFFAGLWCAADWCGRVRYRPARLRAEIFPYEPEIDAHALVQELIAADEDDPMVTVYNDGQHLVINNFERHQNPVKKERDTPSKHPDPNPDRTGTIPERSQNDPGTEPVPLIPDILIPDILKPDILKPDSGSAGRVKSKSAKADYGPILKIWQERAVPAGLPDILKIEGKRKAALQARAADLDWMQALPEAVEALLASDWHMGRDSGKWRADLDWFIKPGNATSLIEKHRAKPTGKAKDSGPRNRQEAEMLAGLGIAP